MKIITFFKTLFLTVFISGFFLSCSNNPDKKQANSSINITRLYTPLFLNDDLEDTLILDIHKDGLCFNQNLDSLSKVGELEYFLLMDLNNEIHLINWHLFIGSLKVIKESDKVYHFIGTWRTSNQGDWSRKFIEYKAIQYTLQIGESHYKFSKQLFPLKGIDSSTSRLKRIKKEIFQNKKCLNENWDIAVECFDAIKAYEYELFAILVNNDLSYKKDYLSLRNDISIVNAGEFSEYLEGNFMFFVFYGLIDEDELNLRNLKFGLPNKDKKYCFLK